MGRGYKRKVIKKGPVVRLNKIKQLDGEASLDQEKGNLLVPDWTGGSHSVDTEACLQGENSS